MQLTNQSVLKILTIALVVAVVLLGAVVAYTFVDQLNSDTPTTEMERAVMAAEEAVRANPRMVPRGRSLRRPILTRV